MAFSSLSPTSFSFVVSVVSPILGFKDLTDAMILDLFPVTYFLVSCKENREPEGVPLLC